MLHTHKKICPKCHSPKMKNWQELIDDEKLLVKSLPLSAEITLEERKKHRFCMRCWFEETESYSERV
jgi:Zn finger protein HypA/HybF involved in hydrogenase expression